MAVTVWQRNGSGRVAGWQGGSVAGWQWQCGRVAIWQGGSVAVSVTMTMWQGGNMAGWQCGSQCDNDNVAVCSSVAGWQGGRVAVGFGSNDLFMSARVYNKQCHPVTLPVQASHCQPKSRLVAYQNACNDPRMPNNPLPPSHCHSITHYTDIPTATQPLPPHISLNSAPIPDL
jgi:hypothetical protein